MEIVQRLSDSIDYIEQHLTEDIDIDKLAKITCSSTFHYQRMFHMLTGVPVAEYIRKRRLTKAAQELSSSKSKVIDIALKYRYDTPESFSKAFRKLHGITPSQVKTRGMMLKAFPKISFQIQIKGVADMKYKIVEKEAFDIIGKGLRVSLENEENKQAIPAFWDECNSNGVSEKLSKQMGEMGFIGACLSNTNEYKDFMYMVAVEKTKDDVANEFDVYTIPAATWAVFEAIGPVPNAINETWDRIYSEWFPATGYEQAPGPELEVYKDDDVQAKDHCCEIWVPVVKK
ncbi:AraC family transcriptional regulator [Alkalihalobacillus sp. LMS39]|uniref:AraC family transcriptional regulator n=1 Tax=Alkalihalobacillus sp. LMS39 TaxID=2924032 RepID=UPI001FB373FF|nr:AraC family transcriptional regulator [Alkalihalobacillus sp. LMS39]UOE95757.1 AraC family transcriptional regulator [Alkalihalobacillus sp. LMS39]